MNIELPDGSRPLTPQLTLEKKPEHIHLAFASTHRVISSAVLNGGLLEARHILNCRVPKVAEFDEDPAHSLQKYCSQQHWSGICVGLMTAASMNSLRLRHETIQGVDIIVMVTSGLSNARRIGDRAEYRDILSAATEIGTINIIVVCSASLTDAALVEALQMVTEAKTAALLALDIPSPISGNPVTGTGTDAVAIASGTGSGTIRYCGKHVRFGEELGKMVMAAVTDSVQWDVSRGKV